MKLSLRNNLLLLAGLTLASSCKKFLEETPNNALPADKSITDAGTARAAITGAYDAVRILPTNF